MRYAVVFLAAFSACCQAGSQLPQRDVTVELRQVEEGYGEPTGYSVSANASSGLPALAYQKILVRNGEKATVRMGQSSPKQWVQSVTSATSSSVPPTTGAATNNGAYGVTNVMEWLQSGYSITVQPRWLGGNKPATVELELEQEDLQTQHNADMPNQARRQFSTTVTAPLAQWVTISSSGEVPKTGVYSTTAANKAGRQALQLRVLVP
jgi:hypothetical protein